jgi:hypothetical protein
LFLPLNRIIINLHIGENKMFKFWQRDKEGRLKKSTSSSLSTGSTTASQAADNPGPILPPNAFYCAVKEAEVRGGYPLAAVFAGEYNAVYRKHPELKALFPGLSEDFQEVAHQARKSVRGAGKNRAFVLIFVGDYEAVNQARLAGKLSSLIYGAIDMQTLANQKNDVSKEIIIKNPNFDGPKTTATKCTMDRGY